MSNSSAPCPQLVASEAGATIPGVDASNYMAFLYDLSEEVAKVSGGRRRASLAAQLARHPNRLRRTCSLAAAHRADPAVASALRGTDPGARACCWMQGKLQVAKFFVGLEATGFTGFTPDDFANVLWCAGPPCQPPRALPPPAPPAWRRRAACALARPTAQRPPRAFARRAGCCTRATRRSRRPRSASLS
jgi:hypothetical protein